MAEALDLRTIRTRLQSPEEIRQDPFSVLKAITSLANSPDTEVLAREFVLRALERREDFRGAAEILNALVRATGLYPYADPDFLDFRDSIAYEFHRPLQMGEDIVFHREQSEVYLRLLDGENVILSAPTSFGKSRIIDAVIATERFTNIAVIVPTLALIDETRRRLSVFSSRYKIVTHLTQAPADRNIFVFTAERAVAYENLPKIDFFVVDEFYKIGALDEDESRTVALNQAFYRLLKGGGQFYLLGPNIQEIPTGLESAYRCYFYPTTFSTVVVETLSAPGQGKSIERLLALVKGFSDPTLIYCSSPARANEVARAMVGAGITIETSAQEDAASWVARTYHPDWIYGTGLLHGIGVHHGRLPRALGQYVVRAFNEQKLQFLICTSTLIEGVNTRAKNVVIWDNEIANRSLDFFTFNNIKGRSGRMFQHFVGRVYLFDEAPQEKLPFVDFPVFTQDGSTPATLLIQMAPHDLTEGSKERIKKYSDQEILSLDTLRQNHSVDPDAQISLARYINENSAAIWPQLAWTGFPNYRHLKFVCELLWKFFVDANRRHGVFSGSQLTLRTWRLFQTKNIARRVLAELQPGQYAAKSPDDAVERVLQFERNWAGFELPRLLRAISGIQRDVLSKKGLPTGDYLAFAAQAESLFRPPIVAALDEYGIPYMVAEKLQRHLRTNDDLDIALKNLKQLDLQGIRLTPFEFDLVADAQKAL